MVPDLYFTPLTYKWQQDDYRPLHFTNETRFSYKDGCCRSKYDSSPNIAVIRGNSYRIHDTINNPKYDIVHVLVTTESEKRRLKMSTFIMPSRVKIHVTNDSISVYVAKYLQGQNITAL